MANLYINPKLTIADKELTVSVARSSGPGGQNVNKVNSKVSLRWNPTSSTSLPKDWCGRFVARHSNRINQAGEVLLSSDRYRDQGRNLADVRRRLVEMLLACQSPPKRRLSTRPTRGSQKAAFGQQTTTLREEAGKTRWLEGRVRPPNYGRILHLQIAAGILKVDDVLPNDVNRGSRRKRRR